jgi:hypothetical protein
MTTAPDPFTALGLPARPDLSDEQVRAAWRAIATVTHPDRPDGGDPARYAAASAAYTMLRSRWGRSEAYADLHAAAPAPPASPLIPAAAMPRAVRPLASPWRVLLLAPARVWYGRPRRLALRICVAALLMLTVTRLGTGPAIAAGLDTGIGTWLVLTARADLAPPTGR